MSDYSGRLKKILRDNGCRFERKGRGDHEIWSSPHSSYKNFTVDGTIKSRHTANEVLKQAGLDKQF